MQLLSGRYGFSNKLLYTGYKQPYKKEREHSLIAIFYILSYCKS